MRLVRGPINGVIGQKVAPLLPLWVSRSHSARQTRTDQGGKQLVKVSYIADEIKWQADYTAVLNKNDTSVDLGGWVTITNQSGARYENATLKLIAGDVRRVAPPRPQEASGAAGSLFDATPAPPPGFAEKSFAEYHLYTLPRPTTVNDNQVKQIELLEPAGGVPVSKFYEYHPNPKANKLGEGDTFNPNAVKPGPKVQVKVEFDNKKENKLGLALPKGKVRVYKKDDADGSLEFVGEDQIDHTPKDEKVTLYIGDAFDIVAETKQVKAESGERWSRQGFEVEIRNHKAEAGPIEVRVMVAVGPNYKIEAETIDGQKTEHTAKDAFTLECEGHSPAYALPRLTVWVKLFSVFVYQDPETVSSLASRLLGRRLVDRDLLESALPDMLKLAGSLSPLLPQGPQPSPEEVDAAGQEDKAACREDIEFNAATIQTERVLEWIARVVVHSRLERQIVVRGGTD